MTPDADTRITPAQIRAIHAAVRAQGLTDDEYRDRLRAAAGVDTCKGLSRHQASAFLSDLGLPLSRRTRTPAPKRPRRRTPPGVVRMASPAQRRLIEALASEIDWRVEDGFRRWLRRNLGMSRVSTSADASRVIEGLKGLKR